VNGDKAACPVLSGQTVVDAEGQRAVVTHVRKATTAVRYVTSGVKTSMRNETFARRFSRLACPDDGVCHHVCETGCFRVSHAEPLSGVFPDDRWPTEQDNTESPNHATIPGGTS
jgi:hypothetical protein